MGVNLGASRDQIKDAYRKLMQKYHPDQVSHLGEEFQAMANEKNKAITKAYNMLCP